MYLISTFLLLIWIYPASHERRDICGIYARDMQFICRKQILSAFTGHIFGITGLFRGM
jgi:hypothetical protein